MRPGWDLERNIWVSFSDDTTILDIPGCGEGDWGSGYPIVNLSASPLPTATLDP